MSTKDRIKEALTTTPEHILQARQMAEAIYSKPTGMHKEMLAEIKSSLIKQHENKCIILENV